MEKEVLSQKEIDSLLSEHLADIRATERTKARKDKTVFKYNFRSQKKINKEQFLLLESLHRRFLRNMEGSLTNLLNIPVIANLTTSTELLYHEFLDSLTAPSCLFVIQLNPGMGRLLLEIDLKFAFFVIDKVLGGSANPNEAPLVRELSLIEERIMHRVITLMLKDLKEAWSMVEEVNFVIEGFYSQAEYIQVIAAEEKIFLVSIDIRSESEIGLINLCLPIPVLEGFVSKNRARRTRATMNRTPEEVEEDRTAITGQVCRSSVAVRAILGQALMGFLDLMNLQPGDVVRLDARQDQPIQLSVGNQPIFKGLIFQNKRYMSVKISDVVE